MTQTLILITWSISESLTDVAALLDGRDVPLWKTPKRFVTNFTEIVLMNHDSLQKRAKRFPKSKKKQFRLSAVSDVVSGNDKTEYEKIPCDGFDSEYNAKKRLQGI